jgi:glycosyltransferase involved in cell wall biosynthesis
MRLALITHRFARGDGQGRVNYEIAKNALAAGHDVWLVANHVAPDLASHARARVVRIGVTGWPTALVRNQVFALRTALWLLRNRKRLDLVHVNGFVTYAQADINTSHFVHAAWLKSPYHTVRVRRDVYGLYQWLYTSLNVYLERRAYRRSALVVGVSEQVKRELLEAGIDEAQLRVIANGVDVEEFRPAPVARRELGLPDGVLLLFVGDIKTPRKNLDTLLHALVDTPDVTLIVVGDLNGSPYPQMADDLQIGERVRFLGYRTDVSRLMRAVDLFVFPSRYEACSLVLLEAAASGLPVVAARTTGGVELLTGESSVLLNDCEDAAELAAALRALASHPAKRAQMGVAARVAAEANSWKSMAARYLQLYGELFARRSGVRT